MPTNPHRNRRIFIVSFLVFLAVVIGVTIDMASRTTAPWNKKKQVLRAFDGVIDDSTTVKTPKDSLKKK